MKTKPVSFAAAIIILCIALAGCSLPARTSSYSSNQPSAVHQTQIGTASDSSEQTNAAENEAETSEASGYINTYPLNDTGQTLFYDNKKVIEQPSEGEDFYGQDAQYTSNEMSFMDNGDGTVTDNVTGLMWTQSPLDEKLTWGEAMEAAESFSLAGYNDWRLPSIKELYSLIDFSGIDPSGLNDSDTSSLTPFINTDYFDFEYGDTSAGERIIDSQYASSTKYVSKEDGELGFGVNFADGRIKGYWLSSPRGDKTFCVMFVRGSETYGENNYIDNGDGTITDLATGLMWMQTDSGQGMNWQEALAWSESLEYAGYDDWRLPNTKELQSIVDYTRSPDTTDSAAINPLFECTAITDEGGNTNYAFYWTGTTHTNTSGQGFAAAYIAFGEALGFMQANKQTQSNQSQYQLMDVHGAGAQRSDPKQGDASEYPYGHGPQGDVIRIENMVRCCRSIEVEA